jgi:DNA topoisomerase-1
LRLSGGIPRGMGARNCVTEPVTDPEESAEAAGLHYVSDGKPGLGRKRAGKGFRYVDAHGLPVRDAKVLGRIKALVIPPAWTDVWISPDARGHLQVTGRDVRGRKQSRYHPRWREVRDETKYERMLLFAEALPGIRRQVAADLARPGLPREKVLATIVRLMEQTLIRVGNEEYARENKSYGLTTMRTKHVEVDGAAIRFTFTGKSGVHHEVGVRDKRLAGIVKRCVELPGYELFQYVDDDGARHAIDSADVNGYLQALSGEHFTAKDFRTWAGSVLACASLGALAPCASAAEAKKNVVQAIAQVASRLGNTPSVCRKCYVHPAVIAGYLGGVSGEGRQVGKRELGKTVKALRREERVLVALLR